MARKEDANILGVCNLEFLRYSMNGLGTFTLPWSLRGTQFIGVVVAQNQQGVLNL